MLFEFKLSAENLTLKESEYLGDLLWLFADGGITVGGRGRAGFGEISITSMKIKLTYRVRNQDTYRIENKEDTIQNERTIHDVLDELKIYALEPHDHTKQPA